MRGEGPDFCLGRKPAPPGGEKRTALEIRSGVVEPILDVYADVRATPVPVLALVQGHARGFGCALAGVCDLTIAADTARFSMPEMDNNLPPTLAISAVLGKVPPKRLVHFVYTRAPIAAAEALAWGLIGEIAPFDQLEPALTHTLSRLVDRDRASSLCHQGIYEYCALLSTPLPPLGSGMAPTCSRPSCPRRRVKGRTANSLRFHRPWAVILFQPRTKSCPVTNPLPRMQRTCP